MIEALAIRATLLVVRSTTAGLHTRDGRRVELVMISTMHAGQIAAPNLALEGLLSVIPLLGCVRAKSVLSAGEDVRQQRCTPNAAWRR